MCPEYACFFSFSPVVYFFCVSVVDCVGAPDRQPCWVAQLSAHEKYPSRGGVVFLLKKQRQLHRCAHTQLYLLVWCGNLVFFLCVYVCVCALLPQLPRVPLSLCHYPFRRPRAPFSRASTSRRVCCRGGGSLPLSSMKTGAVSLERVLRAFLATNPIEGTVSQSLFGWGCALQVTENGDRNGKRKQNTITAVHPPAVGLQECTPPL